MVRRSNRLEQKYKNEKKEKEEKDKKKYKKLISEFELFINKFNNSENENCKIVVISKMFNIMNRNFHLIRKYYSNEPFNKVINILEIKGFNYILYFGEELNTYQEQQQDQQQLQNNQHQNHEIYNLIDVNKFTIMVKKIEIFSKISEKHRDDMKKLLCDLSFYLCNDAVKIIYSFI